MKSNDLHWLAGWLEGEGSFIKGPPSKPNLPIISVCCTDEDVVAKAAKLFKVKYRESKRKNKKRHWKKVWATRIVGKKAFNLMIKLKPLMSLRRKSQIDIAMSCYSAKSYKLTKEIVKEIKQSLRDKTIRQSEIARKFSLARETIVKINTGKLWANVVV